MTIKERRSNNNQPNRNLKPVTLQFSFKYWYGGNVSNQPATITQISLAGATITTQFKLKVGQQVQLTIISHNHIIKQLPAEIISSENKGIDYEYGIHFRLAGFPKTAADNAQSVLQLIEHSFRQIS